MKKILLFVCVFTLYAVPAFAASPIPAGYPPPLQPETGSPAPAAMPEIDYLNPKTVPLTEKEKKALRLSGSWSRQGVEPPDQTVGRTAGCGAVCPAQQRPDPDG